MVEAAPSTITIWLQRLHAGEAGALERLVPLVYDELRDVARRQLNRERRQATLSATALVHEAYLRLLQQRRIAAGDRETFLSVAAQTMRRILVDHARRRQRLKRGGEHTVELLEEALGPALLADREVDEVLAVDQLIERLAAADERAARVVEYRIFAGLTLEETAAALGTSVKTVQRGWVAARAWLRKEMAAGSLAGSGDGWRDQRTR
jgi:RNA polymerase sigma-70 factor, ECF subfamily